MTLDLQRLFRHMAWADARVLDCLRTAPDPRGLRLFAHLLAAEQVWLARLRAVDSSALEIWPTLDPEECAALAERNRVGYTRFLDGLSGERLSSPVVYRNSQGVEFATSVGDILTHVALHGSYHRGQIAAAVRASGAEPVNTDYITFVREGAPGVRADPGA